MPWPTVQVELGFGSDPTSDALVFDDANRGKFDTGQFAVEGGLWTDVSAYVTGIRTSRGRQRLLEAYSRGTCTVEVDNATGRFSPHNTAGAYYPYLRPEVRIRISVTYGGTTYRLFHGFVDSFAPTFGHPDGGSCVIQATDGFKVLARYDPPAASSAVGSGELTGARLNRILDLASWPAGDRDIDTGITTHQATTLAQNALTECQLTADSEGGELFVSGDGKITFRDRHTRWENSTSQSVQATFTDAVGTTQLRYNALDIPEYDAELVKNTVAIAAVGSSQATASDATSQARYWDRTWNRRDLVFDGGTLEAQNYADKTVFFFKNPEQRVDGISVRGLTGSPAGLWAAMFGLDFGHRIRLIRTPVAGDAFDKQLFVEGVEHTIRPGYVFDTKFRTSSATQVDASMFIFDSSTYGKFDTGMLSTY